MIKTIIFDIAGVLVGFDWAPFFKKYFHDDETILRLRDALFGHGVWSELDRGVWTDEELIQGFASAAPDLEDKIRLFYQHMDEALWQYDFSKDWIRELQGRGYRVLFLSNWSYRLLRRADLTDFTPLMDGGIFSCQVHKLKPNADIYQEILRKYDLEADECVFLDDTLPNVEGAKACGLHAIHVKNHEQAVEALEKLLTGSES